MDAAPVVVAYSSAKDTTHSLSLIDPYTGGVTPLKFEPPCACEIIQVAISVSENRIAILASPSGISIVSLTPGKKVQHNFVFEEASAVHFIGSELFVGFRNGTIESHHEGHPPADFLRFRASAAPGLPITLLRSSASCLFAAASNGSVYAFNIDKGRQQGDNRPIWIVQHSAQRCVYDMAALRCGKVVVGYDDTAIVFSEKGKIDASFSRQSSQAGQLSCAENRWCMLSVQAASSRVQMYKKEVTEDTTVYIAPSLISHVAMITRTHMIVSLTSGEVYLRHFGGRKQSVTVSKGKPLRLAVCQGKFTDGEFLKALFVEAMRLNDFKKAMTYTIYDRDFFLLPYVALFFERNCPTRRVKLESLTAQMKTLNAQTLVSSFPMFFFGPDFIKMLGPFLSGLSIPVRRLITTRILADVATLASQSKTPVLFIQGNSFIKYIVDNEYINFAESGSSILALREAVKPMASQVTRLHISNVVGVDVITSLSPLIQQCANLEIVEIKGVLLDEHQLERLVIALHGKDKIISLILQNCGVTPAGASMILMHYIESKLPRTISIQGIDDCRIDTGAPVFKMIAQEAKGKFGPAFQYVRDLIMYGEETVRRCKVMIVGRQAVGKTSLFQTLVPIKAIGKYDWVFSAFSSVQPILQLVGQFLYFFKSGSETLRYTIDSSCTIEYQGLVLVLKSKVPPKAPTFLLCTSASSESSAKGIAPVHHSTDASFHFQIEFKSQSTLMEWHQRLQHWIDNRATEGITTTVATFSGEGSSGREITPITLSFMDFAGQIEFDPSFSLFPLISRIDSMPCIVTSSVAARCFWYVFERFVAFLIQQVLWNMSARPKGDLFFECLVAELRGVGVSLPEPIRTKLKFNAWLQGRTFQAASDLSALEALFPSGPKGKKILKIVIECDTGKTISSSSAGSAAKHTIQLRVDDIDSPDRRFFSSRAPLVSDPMFGLDGLRFWLADLKAHLPVVKDSPSISIFIVGTHKDLADGTCESRSADVAKIVAEVGLEHQYVIHEVSCSSDAEFAGIKELRADMLEAINGLPHMEEKAPTILGQVQQTMNEWVKELEQESADAISSQIVHVDHLLQRLPEKKRILIEHDMKETAVKVSRLHELAATESDQSRANQYKKMAQSTTNVLQRVLLLLHEWGLCVYFFKSGLKDVVCLSVEYLTVKTLSRLFNPAYGKLQCGKIHVDDLVKFWAQDCKIPKEVHSDMLQMMELLSISFSSDTFGATGEAQQKKTLFVPSLLDPHPPDSALHGWPLGFHSNEKAVFLFFDHMPDEFIGRLLVELMQNMTHFHVAPWRHGVMAKHEGYSMLVRKEPISSQIMLTIRGDKLQVSSSPSVNRQTVVAIRIRGPEGHMLVGFMHWILSFVDTVHDMYPGIRKWKLSMNCWQHPPLASVACFASLDGTPHCLRSDAAVHEDHHNSLMASAGLDTLSRPRDDAKEEEIFALKQEIESLQHLIESLRSALNDAVRPADRDPELEDHLARAQAAFAEKEAELARADAERLELERKLRQSQVKEDSLKQALVDARSQRDQAEAAKDGALKSVELSKKSLAELQGKLQTLETSLAQTEKKLQKQSKDVELQQVELESKLEELKAMKLAREESEVKLKKAEEMLALLESEQSGAAKTNQEALKQIDSLRKQLDDDREALSKANIREEDLQSNCQALKLKLDKVIEQKNLLENKLVSQADELKTARERAENLLAERNAALERIKDLELQFEIASNDASALNKQYKIAAKENSRLNAESAQLKEKLDEARKEKESLQRELSEFQRKHAEVLVELEKERQQGQFSRQMVAHLQQQLASANHLNEKLTQQLGSIHAHLQNSFVHDYPSAYLFTRKDGSGFQQRPKKKGLGARLLSATKHIGKAIESAFIDDYYCYVLCEFQCSRSSFPGVFDPQWHRVAWEDQGKHVHFRKTIKDASKFAKEIVGVLRATCLVLKIAAVLGRVAGVPVPDLTECIPEEIMEIVFNTQDTAVAVLATSFLDEDDAEILDALRGGSIQPESVRPVTLQGHQLDLVKSKFEHQKSGFVGPLTRQVIIRDGPYGASGTLLWVCPHHAEVIRMWNCKDIETDELARALAAKIIPIVDTANPVPVHDILRCLKKELGLEVDSPIKLSESMAHVQESDI